MSSEPATGSGTWPPSDAAASSGVVADAGTPADSVADATIADSVDDGSVQDQQDPGRRGHGWARLAGLIVVLIFLFTSTAVLTQLSGSAESYTVAAHGSFHGRPWTLVVSRRRGRALGCELHSQGLLLVQDSPTSYRQARCDYRLGARYIPGHMQLRTVQNGAVIFGRAPADATTVEVTGQPATPTVAVPGLARRYFAFAVSHDVSWKAEWYPDGHAGSPPAEGRLRFRDAHGNELDPDGHLLAPAR